MRRRAPSATWVQPRTGWPFSHTGSRSDASVIHKCVPSHESSKWMGATPCAWICQWQWTSAPTEMRERGNLLVNRQLVCAEPPAASCRWMAAIRGALSPGTFISFAPRGYRTTRGSVLPCPPGIKQIACLPPARTADVRRTLVNAILGAACTSGVDRPWPGRDALGTKDPRFWLGSG